MTKREDIGARFRSDISRVQGLVVLYEAHAAGVYNEEQEQLPDLLRAAVVLLHASLEELLRSREEWRLPTSRPASLERIPLAAAEKDKNQFTLVDLAEFRGRSVDSIIEQSITNYLTRSSYNHPGDIVEVLRKTEIDFAMPDDLKTQLAAMMSRRHRIAHRGDRDESELVNPLRRQHGVQIFPQTVRGWITSVITLGESILSRV